MKTHQGLVLGLTQLPWDWNVIDCNRLLCWVNRATTVSTAVDISANLTINGQSSVFSHKKPHTAKLLVAGGVYVLTNKKVWALDLCNWLCPYTRKYYIEQGLPVLQAHTHAPLSTYCMQLIAHGHAQKDTRSRLCAFAHTAQWVTYAYYKIITRSCNTNFMQLAVIDASSECTCSYRGSRLNMHHTHCRCVCALAREE